MTQPWSDGRIHGFYNTRGDLVLVDEGEGAPPGPGWTSVQWRAEAPEITWHMHQVSVPMTVGAYWSGDAGGDFPEDVWITGGGYRFIPDLPYDWGSTAPAFICYHNGLEGGESYTPHDWMVVGKAYVPGTLIIWAFGLGGAITPTAPEVF